jgi:hypothetical protein
VEQLGHSIATDHAGGSTGENPTTPAAIEARLRQEGVDPENAFGHFETDCGREVGRDDEFAPPWFTDAHAVLLHRVRCGCAWPENSGNPFYGGRTRMPFPTFSASAEDLG